MPYGCYGDPRYGAGVPGMVPCRVQTRCAHHTEWDECIYGVP